MKKVIALILAALLAFTALACGKTDNGDNGNGGEIEPKIVSKLVENGKSAYSIVIPENADECNEFAAEELRRYIERASGARLAIMRDDALPSVSTDGKYISLGKTKILAGSGVTFDYSSLNGDGFYLKTAGKTLLVDGARNTGVLYGAYEILESLFGVRFLTDDYTFVPTVTEVELRETDRKEVPAVQSRDYFAYPAMNDLDYVSHMRFSTKYRETPARYGDTGLNAWFAGAGHTLLAEAQALVPYSVYGEEHPDWYYRNGEELRYTNGITENDEFDPTDTESLAYNLVEICKKRILENKTARYFMLGQPDNNAWDDSAEAIASEQRNGGKSGTLMVFINAIAGEIEKWMKAEGIDREVTFVTFAYWKTLDAPVRPEGDTFVPVNEKVVPRDNVAIMIAHMTCTYHSLYDRSCSDNLRAAAIFRQWNAICDKLFVWDYNTNFDNHFFWYPNFNSLVPNIRYYVDKGVIEVMAQGAPHVGNYYQCKLEGYLFSKLLWNPDLDPSDLIAEFNRLYFGDSARAADDFVELMRAHYASLDEENHYFHNELYSKRDFTDFKWYPIGFLEKAMGIVETEIARVAGSDLSETDKRTRTDRLYEIWIHPAYMTLKNYAAYYDASGQKAFAEKFFSVTDRLRIGYYGEGASIASLKSKYGIN